MQDKFGGIPVDETPGQDKFGGIAVEDAPAQAAVPFYNRTRPSKEEIRAEIERKSTPVPGPFAQKALELLGSAWSQGMMTRVAHPITTLADVPHSLLDLLGVSKQNNPFPYVEPGQVQMNLLEVPPNANLAPGWRPSAEAVASTVNEMATPENVVMLPLFAEKNLGPALLRTANAAMGASLAEQAPDLYKTLMDPNTPPETKQYMATKFGLGSGMLGLGVYGAGHLGEKPGLEPREAAKVSKDMNQFQAERDIRDTLLEQTGDTELYNKDVEPTIKDGMIVTPQDAAQAKTDKFGGVPVEKALGETPQQRQIREYRENRQRETSGEAGSVRSDFDLYEKLVGQVRAAGTAEEKFSLQKQIEDLKNRYGGFPPPRTPPLQTFGTSTEDRLRNEDAPFGMQVAKDNTVPTAGLVQRIKAQAGQGEYSMLQEAGLDEFLEGKQRVNVGELTKWVEENGPKVEVRKFGEGAQTPEEREYHKMSHEWYDNLSPTVKNDVLLILAGREAPGISAKQKANALRYKELRAMYEGGDLAQANAERAHWSSIAPKPESEMPGYTEISVVRPRKLISYDEFKRQFGSGNEKNDLAEYKQIVEDAKQGGKGHGSNLYDLTKFPSTHSFPPNTLGWVRGYMETVPESKLKKLTGQQLSDREQAEAFAKDPANATILEPSPNAKIPPVPMDRLRAAVGSVFKGKVPEKMLKVFRIIEVQSDWARQVKERREGVMGTTPRGQELVKNADPRLEHYESLALKAAIDHAVKEGADAVSVDDAQTAMLTEGHDRMSEPMIVDTKEQATTTEGIYGLEHEGTPTSRQLPDGRWLVYLEPSQEKGMTAAYDIRLPNILKKLTGSEGTKAEFGEHKMAYAMNSFEIGHYYPTEAEARWNAERNGLDPNNVVKLEGGKWGIRTGPRQDLIFRNPDGTPKTTSTGKVYDLSKFKSEAEGKQFSQFGRKFTTEETAKPKGEMRALKPGEKGEPRSPEAMGITPQPPEWARKAVEKGTEWAHKVLDKIESVPIPSPKVPFVYDTKSALPDLQNKKLANETFSEKFGAEKVPVLGRMLGGKARIASEKDQALSAWYAERYGVGPAVASSVGADIHGKIDSVFKTDKQGDMNVKPMNPTMSTKVSDVFENLQRNPKAYDLTDAQRQVWEKTIKPILDKMSVLAKKYKLVDVVDENGDFKPYFPRIVTERKSGESPQSASGRVGAKQGFQKERLYETEQQGWQDGTKYVTSPEERIVRGVERLYRAMADKRLATDPVLQGRSFARLVDDLKEYFAEDLASGKMTEKQITNIAKAKMAEGTVHQPAFFGKTFDKETAATLNTELQREHSNIRRIFATGNSLAKGLRLGFDLGVGQIQLLPLLYGNPKAWGIANAKSLHALFSKEAFPEYARQNMGAIRELAQVGSGVGHLQEYLGGLEKGQPLTKMPVLGPIANAFGRQFQTALDVAKIEMWKAWREVTPKEQWPKLAQSIEAVLGSSRMESSMVTHARSLTERSLLLAPSYYRAAVNIVPAMLEANVSGKVARRTMGAFAVGSLVTFYAAAKMSGMKDDEIERRLNPANSKFMMWDVKQGDKTVSVGMGGIYRSVLRLMGNVVETSIKHPENWKSLTPDKNPLVRWARGHGAPLPSLAFDQFSGKDFMGADVDLESVGPAMLPLWAAPTSTGEKQTPLEFGVGFMGGSAFQSAPSQQQRATELFGKEVGQLNLAQRKQLQDTQPVVKGREERSAIYATQQEFQRQRELNAALSKPSQDWLALHGLKVPSYETEVWKGVRMTEDEQKAYAVGLAKSYDMVIQRLSQNPAFDRMTSKQGQEVLGKVLEKVRAAERAKILSRVGR